MDVDGDLKWVQARLAFDDHATNGPQPPGVMTGTTPTDIPQNRPVLPREQGGSVSRWFDLTEDEYIRSRFVQLKASLERERTARQKELETLRPRARTKRLSFSLRLRVIAQELQEIEQQGLTPARENKYRLEYRDRIKNAIREGEPVPPEIIAQRVEFQRARDGRARYQKGRHTSFANASIAVDLRLFETRGVKIKLQNGKPMRAEIAEEIERGLEEIEMAIGSSLRDLLKGTDVTISHTLGKHPFMRGDAGGLFFGEKLYFISNTCIGTVPPILTHDVACSGKLNIQSIGSMSQLSQRLPHATMPPVPAWLDPLFVALARASSFCPCSLSHVPPSRTLTNRRVCLPFITPGLTKIHGRITSSRISPPSPMCRVIRA